MQAGGLEAGNHEEFLSHTEGERMQLSSEANMWSHVDSLVHLWSTDADVAVNECQTFHEIMIF